MRTKEIGTKEKNLERLDYFSFSSPNLFPALFFPFLYHYVLNTLLM
jgi:hypothetical protein